MALAMTLAALLPTSAALAGVLVSQDEALAEAFPDATLQRRTAFLEEEQVAAIEKAAGSSLDSRVVTHYRGERDGELLGTAYFDAHQVRTLPETLMVVVARDGTVAKIEIRRVERALNVGVGRQVEYPVRRGAGALPLSIGEKIFNQEAEARAARELRREAPARR